MDERTPQPPWAASNSRLGRLHGLEAAGQDEGVSRAGPPQSLLPWL